MTRRQTATVIVLLVAAVVAATATYIVYTSRPRTIADVVAKYGPDARRRLAPHFKRAGVSYPPRDIALLVFKQERRVALWARSGGAWRYVRAYPIFAASGHAGPKLRQGDSQVPEGVYRIEHLNPNSNFHLSMKVGYPNAFDRQMAGRDRRTNLGGDIFIHGNAVSIGCVAVGDRAIEELFVLVAEIGHARVKVIIAPNDLRVAGPVLHTDSPSWVTELYRTIVAALVAFPAALESDSAVDVSGWRSKAKVRPMKGP